MKTYGLKSRRQFIKETTQFCGACSLLLPLSVPSLQSAVSMPLNNSDPASANNNNAVSNLTEARYYEKLPNRKIKCVLCPRECVIDDQETGYCGVRENYNGTYCKQD